MKFRENEGDQLNIVLLQSAEMIKLVSLQKKCLINKRSNRIAEKESKNRDSLRENNQTYNKDFNFNFSEISENKDNLNLQTSKTKMNYNRAQRPNQLLQTGSNVKPLKIREFEAGEDNTDIRGKINNADQFHKFLNKAGKISQDEKEMDYRRDSDYRRSRKVRNDKTRKEPTEENINEK